MALIKVYDVIENHIYETNDGSFFINVKADIGKKKIQDFSLFVEGIQEGEEIIKHFTQSNENALYPIFIMGEFQ